MKRSTLKTVREYLAAHLLGGLATEELRWLLSSSRHLALLESRRTEMIISRIKLVAGIFTVLTPLWIFVDYFAFAYELWIWLAVARVVATGALIYLLLNLRERTRKINARAALLLLFLIPSFFYIVADSLFQMYGFAGFSKAIMSTHEFLPFLLLAGMSIFPLTLAEGSLLAAFLLLTKVWASFYPWMRQDWFAVAADIWLLVLMAAVAIIASVSQLAFVIVLVRQAIRDTLTGCFSRRSGEELLTLQFNLSTRSRTPLTVAFIDLDRFKDVNDRFGHQAGDHVLRQVAQTIMSSLRTGDVLARWGGEEFLLIMPNTARDVAVLALERARAGGFGSRPDHKPQTVSIGVAERTADHMLNARALTALADARMYTAKQHGRDRIVAFGEL